MRRRAPRQDDASPSLFPFLAVLICTVGALIVLLVVVVQQARVQAKSVDASPEEDTSAVAQRHAMQQQRQEYLRRAELLEHEQQAGKSQLATQRDSLARLNQNIHQLSQELARLDDTDAALRRRGSEVQQSIANSQRELAELRQRVDEAKQRLQQAEADATGQRQPYALIPYDGPNETRRRPIYLECLQDRVILQPEGITFLADDFQGLLGPNNPLAAALRATRAYLARGKGISNYEQAYPLLVVRPDGAEAYAAARAAMRSWDSEFGYELVTSDMELAYPPADPELAQALRGIVELARQRQRRAATLAAFPAGRSRGNSSSGFRASGRGGFVPSGSDFADGGEESDYDGTAPGNGFGSRRTRSGTGGPGGTRNSGASARGRPGTGSWLGQGQGGNRGPAGIAAIGNESGQPGMVGRSGSLAPRNIPGGQPVGEGQANGNRQLNAAGDRLYGSGRSPGSYPSSGGLYGQSGADSNARHGAGDPGQGRSTGSPSQYPTQGNAGKPGQVPSGTVGELSNAATAPGQSDSAGAGRSGPAGQGGRGATGGGPHGATAPGPGGASTQGPNATAEQGPNGVNGPSQASATGTAQSGAAGGATAMGGSAAAMGGMQGAPSQQAKVQPGSVAPLAQSRGRNWALPNSNRGAIGITRPLTVICYAERLVLRPEPGTSAKPQAIPFRATTRSAVQPLVDAIWKRVEGWGIAGPNVYWKPELHVTIAPGTELRFAELNALMRESGVTIVRN